MQYINKFNQSTLAVVIESTLTRTVTVEFEIDFVRFCDDTLLSTSIKDIKGVQVMKENVQKYSHVKHLAASSKVFYVRRSI